MIIWGLVSGAFVFTRGPISFIVRAREREGGRKEEAEKEPSSPSSWPLSPKREKKKGCSCRAWRWLFLGEAAPCGSLRGDLLLRKERGKGVARERDPKEKKTLALHRKLFCSADARQWGGGGGEEREKGSLSCRADHQGARATQHADQEKRREKKKKKEKKTTSNN